MDDYCLAMDCRAIVLNSGGFGRLAHLFGRGSTTVGVEGIAWYNLPQITEGQF